MTTKTYQQARFNMIEQQVRPFDVFDARVLKVMGEIPRENFVSDEFKDLAYADIEIPLEDEQHMLKPIVVGRLLQALDIKPTDSILEIGTGSGYVTACLANLGKHVTSVEISTSLANKAGENLTPLDRHNISLEVGDALKNIPQKAPFDVIAITGSISDCLHILPKELNDGGRLFIITGEPPIMSAQLITRINGDIFKQETLFETSAQALHHPHKKDLFTF